MTDTHPLIANSIAGGLIRLLQEKSREIDTECARFHLAGDAEALHDLRVAMRRAHSLFAGFASSFSDETTLPEQLRALQKTTNAARDLEVTLVLMAKLKLELPDLQQQWQEQLAREYRRLREQLPPAWQMLSAQLDRPSELLLESLPETPLGPYAAALATGERKKLLGGIKSLGKKWGDRRAHRLRIHGKRMRYLLEPFIEESKAAATAVNHLKRFQDLLGDYHDSVVLRQKLHCLRLLDSPLPMGTVRLDSASRRLKKSLRQQRKTFIHAYPEKRGQGLCDVLRQAEDSLAQG